MPTHHKTEMLHIGSLSIECDSEIVDLIRAINSIPGIVTTNSCQGDFGLGYIQFKHSDDTDACIRFLQAMIARMSGSAGKRQELEDEYVQKHGMRNGTKGFALHFTIELGRDCCMRWLPDTYPFVLAEARQVAFKMTGKSDGLPAQP